MNSHPLLCLDWMTDMSRLRPKSRGQWKGSGISSVDGIPKNTCTPSQVRMNTGETGESGGIRQLYSQTQACYKEKEKAFFFYFSGVRIGAKEIMNCWEIFHLCMGLIGLVFLIFRRETASSRPGKPPATAAQWYDQMGPSQKCVLYPSLGWIVQHMQDFLQTDVRDRC